MNLSCNGIGLKIDDRLAKQFVNHVLKHNSDSEMYNRLKKLIIENEDIYAWMESWHRKNEVADLKKFVNNEEK